MERIDLTQPITQAMTLLIYGSPGIGKSTVCAMLAAAAEASGESATLLDSERGLLPAAMASGLQNSELLSASGKGAALEVLQKLHGMIAAPQGLVVLDTVTETSEAILRELAGDSGTIQIQAYGEQKNRLARIVRALRDAAGAGTCAVATAQQDAQDIEGLPGNWHPSVRKSMVTDLVSQFDCVARVREVAEHEVEALNLEAGTRYLDFRPSHSQVAKCRTAGELFDGRGSQWHLWPMRNQDDATRLYAALKRRTAQMGNDNG